MAGCSITDEYERRGIETVRLENDCVRIEVLAGKGGDVTEFVDKRTDTNVLFESPHEWRAPASGYVGAPDRTFSFMDYYPGGWQDVIPSAGGPADAHGATFSANGQSSLIPWGAMITEESPAIVSVELSVSLTRYPLDLERTLTLRENESKLEVTEMIRNTGTVTVDYTWLQHIALGEPLVAPNATLEVPCETVRTDPDHASPNSRFPSGERFDWPVFESGSQTVDLRTFPSKDRRVHDLVILSDLRDGVYTVRNDDIDLAASVRFPEDLFEYIWYWQPFGGYEGAPYFGRNYNVGLEPCTSFPGSGLEAARENGTVNQLAPGATESATFELETTNVTGE